MIAKIDLSASDSVQIFILLSLSCTLLTHRNNEGFSQATGQQGNIIIPILQIHKWSKGDTLKLGKVSGAFTTESEGL